MISVKLILIINPYTWLLMFDWEAFEEIRERRDCYLGGDGGRARGDGGRTAGRWQACTVVNGIYDFSSLWPQYCTVLLLLVLLETATLFLPLGTWCCTCSYWNCWNCTMILLLLWTCHCMMIFVFFFFEYDATLVLLSLLECDTMLGSVETDTTLLPLRLPTVLVFLLLLWTCYCMMIFLNEMGLRNML